MPGEYAEGFNGHPMIKSMRGFRVGRVALALCGLWCSQAPDRLRIHWIFNENAHGKLANNIHV